MSGFVEVLYGKRMKTYEVPEMPILLLEQIEDGCFLFEQRHAALFSEPGTGKTLAALYALMKAHTDLEDKTGHCAKVLIVVPSIAVRNWVIWLACSLDMTEGKSGIQVIKSGHDEIPNNTDHIICTYGMLSRGDSPLVVKLKEWEPEVVILDESHNLSNASSTRTKVIYEKLIETASFVWCLTGTPVIRYSDDLYSTLMALRPDLMNYLGYKNLTKFREKFCVVKLMRFGRQLFPKTVVVRNKNMEELNDLIYTKNIARRRLLIDIAPKLPQIRERMISVSFNQSRALLDLTTDAMEVQRGFDGVDIISPTMARACHLLGVEKALCVVDYLEELEREKLAVGDDKATIVLYWHREAGRAMQQEAEERGFTVGLIDGSTSSNQRDKLVESFNKGELHFLLGQIAAMGVSLNLQEGGNHAVFAERSWSDASNEQAYSRIFRMGQDSDVTVDYLISDSPLEEARTTVLARKKSGTKQIIERMQ